MSRSEKNTRKLRPNEDGVYEVKFSLLKRLKNLETPDSYTNCSKHTKRKHVINCVAANIKVYFREIENENNYVFKFI